MEKKDALTNILSNPAFAPYIVEDRLLPAKEGVYTPLPTGLDPALAAALRKQGIQQIYSHQKEVFDYAQTGKNVVVVTPTASGKTLCYNLPVLQTLLNDKNARALYMFPTKALSQDQQAELNTLFDTVNHDRFDEQPINKKQTEVPLQVVTYDGDTPADLRGKAREAGRIIISNPDMLHQGILPNHPKWIKFFSNLKYIVIDEAHSYRGVFGSHVANVIRRLKRIAAFYHAHPQFILCSATIANPKELAQALIGEEAALVNKNGSPGGEKRVILYNPPLVDPIQGIRRSSLNESRRWMLALLRSGIKTILFAHSRIRTEVAASYVNEDLANTFTNNSNIKVEAYRGGLLPNERHEIERGLRTGDIQGVVSTNALELGIDIGGLDASIVCGFPGSFNSFWQQSGRAGRRGGTSVSVFIASAAPVDQFIVQNPQWFFNKPSEEGRIDSNNPYIYTDHIKCACFELPFIENSPDPFGNDTWEVLAFLEEEGIVRRTVDAANQAKWHWANRSFPAEGVSLRSAGADNVVIVDTTHGRNTVIGEMDRPSAKEMLFNNAVYIHRGNQYMVTNLDIQNRKAFVVETAVNYFTDGLVKRDIKVLSEDRFFNYSKDGVNDETTGQVPVHVTCTAVLGDVLVRSQVTKFKKLKFRTHENIGFGEIQLPEEEMQSRALMLLFGSETRGGEALSEMSEEEIAACLNGAGTLIKNIAAVFLLCDPRDLGIAAYSRDLHFNAPALYIYDKYPGGTGLAEALAERVPTLFGAIFRSLSSCRCKSGCPSCVGPGGNKSDVLKFLRPLC